MRHPREALALRDELSELERARLDAHVTSCVACRGLARQLDAARRALAVPEPPMHPPPMRRRRERGAYGGFVAMTAAIAVLLAVAAVVTSIRDAQRDGVAATAPPGSRGTALATPQPTPLGWPARTVAEVSANLARDENFAVALRALTSGADPDPRAVGRTPVVGTPLLVRGLRPTDGNVFLVPVVVDSTTIAVMVVPIGRDGNGQLVATRGWSSAPSFPAQSANTAIALAGLSGQPGVRAELVWTYLRGLADEMRPFWRIELAGRAVSYVFEDNTVISASDLGIE